MQTAPPAPADRLAALIVRLVSAVFARRVGAHLGFVPVPLVMLITDRLREVSQRFRRLAERLQAGWVYQPRQTAPRDPAGRPPRVPPEPREPPDPSLALINQVRLMPGLDLEAVKREFGHLLLTDPDMQAVMQAAPVPAWRILSPLCRMIGMPRPAILAPPPRPKAEKPPKPPKAPKPPRVRKPPFVWMAERVYDFSAHWPRGIPGKPKTA
jgi:hypothetical protein